MNKGTKFPCLQATLERAVKVLTHSQDSLFQTFESETVTMAMGLLTVVLTGEETVVSKR